RGRMSSSLSSSGNIVPGNPNSSTTAGSATAAAPAPARAPQASASAQAPPSAQPSAVPAQSAGSAAAPAPAPFSVPGLLGGMLRSAPKISDLFFSPGKPPMVEVNGKLKPIGGRSLPPDDPRHIAAELIGNNEYALGNLRDQGSCDVSYSLAGTSRFRV